MLTREQVVSVDLQFVQKLKGCKEETEMLHV